MSDLRTRQATTNGPSWRQEKT